MSQKVAYPISAVCPNCGNGNDFMLEKPEKFIAFASDRVCRACATRYSPPTPRWAGAVWILLGLFAVAAGALGMWLVSMPGTYLIALGLGATVRGVAWLLKRFGNAEPNAPAATLDRWYLDALPALGVSTLSVMFEAFVVEHPHAPPDKDGMIFMIVLIIMLAMGSVWTFIGIMGARVVYHGFRTLIILGGSEPRHPQPV